MAKVNPIQMQKFLKGMDYPAKKGDLVNHAKNHGADEEVISMLNDLPQNDFKSAADVSRAFGKL